MIQEAKSAKQLKETILNLTGGEKLAFLSESQVRLLNETIAVNGVTTYSLGNRSRATGFRDLFGEWSIDLELFRSDNGNTVLKTLAGDRFRVWTTMLDDPDWKNRWVSQGFVRRLHWPTVSTDWARFGHCRRIHQPVSTDRSDWMNDTRSTLRHFLCGRHWSWLTQTEAGLLVNCVTGDRWRSEYLNWSHYQGMDGLLHPDEQLYGPEYDEPTYYIDNAGPMLSRFLNNETCSFDYCFAVSAHEGGAFFTVELHPCGHEWFVYIRIIALGDAMGQNPPRDKHAIAEFLLDKERDNYGYWYLGE